MSAATCKNDAAMVKMVRPSASINQPAHVASRTSQPVMMMGTSMKPSTSTFFGQSTPAEAVKVPTMHQATP